LRVLEDADVNNYMVTGLIYVDPDASTMFDLYDLPDEALNRLSNDRLRPAPDTLEKINAMML